MDSNTNKMFWIVYDGGDKSVLTIIEKSERDYDFRDYMLASRSGYDSYEKALYNIKHLANNFNKSINIQFLD